LIELELEEEEEEAKEEKEEKGTSSSGSCMPVICVHYDCNEFHMLLYSCWSPLTTLMP